MAAVRLSRLAANLPGRRNTVAYAHRRSPSSRLAALQKLRPEIDRELHRLGIAELVPRAVVPASVAEFEHWALDFLTEQSGHAQAAGSAREVSYVIHHLSYGGWLGTINVAGRQPRPLDANQGHLEEARVRPSSSTSCSKTSSENGIAAAAWSPDEASLQVISREFAEELVRPMRAGQEATFTAEFVRRWHENRRQRFGATA